MPCQMPRPTGSAVVATRLTSSRAPIFVIRVMTSSTSAISASVATANPVPSVSAPSSWLTITDCNRGERREDRVRDHAEFDPADDRDRDRLAERAAESEHRGSDDTGADPRKGDRPHRLRIGHPERLSTFDRRTRNLAKQVTCGGRDDRHHHDGEHDP